MDRQYFHLGKAATSRVESSHAFLKKRIGSSSRDMLMVFERIKNGIRIQLDILKVDPARDCLQNPLLSSRTLFAEVTTRITGHFIKLIGKQLSMAKTATNRAPFQPCTNVWTGTMGLP